MSQADLVVRWQDDVARIAADVVAMHFYREIYRRVTQIAVDQGGLDKDPLAMPKALLVVSSPKAP